MFQIDAKKAKFTLVEVFGRPALFTTECINRATVPEGLHAYDMQTSEDDWDQPCLLGKHITVEHFGTVLVSSPIKLGENGYRDMEPKDFTMGMKSRLMTVAEFLAAYPPKEHPQAKRSSPDRGAR